MKPTYDVLILGATYGSLLATKLLAAGHNVRLMCLPAEADIINAKGTRVWLPIKGRTEPIEIDSRTLPGKLSAEGPTGTVPGDYDLVVLAMQEPQYQAPSVRPLLEAIARARVPCMSIMNMPPLTYLRRIPSIDVEPLKSCYTDAAVWQHFDPALMTLCSPDPQAVRPPDAESNVLRVTLPSNFKAARFESENHTEILRRLQTDIEAVRYKVDGQPSELPVKLKVHDSIFVPLAKWPMLLTGNYRCVQAQGPRTIREAVHTDLEESRAVYQWVRAVCLMLGAQASDLVPFEKYAAAAQTLTRPSSVARALFAGAPNVERVDLLVKTIAAQYGLRSATVDERVATVDALVAQNRRRVA